MYLWQSSHCLKSVQVLTLFKEIGGGGAIPVKYNVQFAFRTVNNDFTTLSTS